jgi:hypothetical protein
MTTAQEPLNGHRVSPPPCSTESPAQTNRADLPTNKADNNNQFAPESQQGSVPAGAYHVPPERYAPKADFRPQEWHSGELDTTPLPERCQFMFSDGRQCSMARSDIHPSLCRFHSEREDQLFGHPTPGGHVVGRAFDLPELYSACRDLTTAAGVNRALGQVFRLLAQRRISRQEAATFGHLAHLLLRSISAAHAEAIDPIRMSVQGESALSDEPGGLAASGHQFPADNLKSRPEPRAVQHSAPFGRENQAAEAHAPRAYPRSQAPKSEVVRAPRSSEIGRSSAINRGASDSHVGLEPPVHPQQDEHLQNAGLQLAHNQHLRNHGTSSHSESTLAEKQEGG